MSETQDVAELLYGMPAIAKYLNITLRQAWYLEETKRIPTFRIGSKPCARKATLRKWVEEHEAAATPPRERPGKP